MPTLNLETVRKKQDSSYVHLLEPQGLLQQAEYNPLYLDNPDLKAIRHKTIITLPFFLGSIIQPSKPDEIRKEIDEHFKETHPQVDPSVTLTQIRATKAKLLLVAHSQDLELSSVAFSYVYLEKLILKGFVRESNMRLVGAVCLLLAAKINDPKDLEYKTLTAAMERILDLPRREVYSNEFSVYSALDFTLFLPLSVISPHLNRILSATDFKDIEGYFGPNEFYLNAPTPNVQSPN
ncbi:hypothetical protein EDD86DRAFT_197401 [Gorgonomyces haynaldii]|nr:hypothetical protein EDD86DRAFT_197401 [Gorgonomyces haynaldii]